MSHPNLIGQEIDDVLTQLASGLVDRSKWRNIIVVVAGNDGNNLLGIDLKNRTANTVGRLLDRDDIATRRIDGRVDVVHATNTMVEG